jgi:hypothetical protein
MSETSEDVGPEETELTITARAEESPAETWEAIDQALQIARGAIKFAQWIGKVTWTVENSPASRRGLAEAFLGLRAERSSPRTRRSRSLRRPPSWPGNLRPLIVKIDD